MTDSQARLSGLALDPEVVTALEAVLPPAGPGSDAGSAAAESAAGESVAARSAADESAEAGDGQA